MECNLLCAQQKVNGISLFQSPMVTEVMPFIAVYKNINKSVYLYT